MIMIGLFFLAVNVSAQEGLVGYWSFDELDGTYFADHTPFGNSGVNYGGELIEGKKGNAIYFDGSKNFGVLENGHELPPSHLKSLGVGSIAFWFRVDHI